MQLIDKIIECDKELFLKLNSLNTTWLDPLMLVLSSQVAWGAVCLFVFLFIVYKGGKWRFVAPIFLLLSIGFNSSVNTVVKWLVLRPRPIHIEAWQGLIHAIEEYETSYSFYSAHSSNSFTIAVFSLLYFRNKYYTIAILLWASTVAYSRIYLAKHYPIDIACGVLMGALVGFVGYRMFEYYCRRKESPITPNL